MKISYAFPLLIVIIFSSCQREQRATDSLAGDFNKVDINTTSEFYDSVMSKSKKPQMVILKENERTMFAFADRILDRNNKYYILDGAEGKTVVSFTHSGEPFASYGQIGQGPGEYKFPRDIAVKDDGLYVLDSQQKKLIHYSDTGEFIDEVKLPFFAEAFCFLENGEIMFNLMPNGKDSPQICITDTTLGNIRYYIMSKDGFIGGLYTNDIIRKYDDNAYFYRAPLDTLYKFSPLGKPDGGIVFCFGDMSIPNQAKLDFISARKNGILEGKSMFTNNPIPLKSGLWVGSIEKDEQTYTVLFDPRSNKSGGKVFDDNASVYEPLLPMGNTQDGKLICILDIEFASECPDFESLPDSILTALSQNNRVLTIFDL